MAIGAPGLSPGLIRYALIGVFALVAASIFIFGRLDSDHLLSVTRVDLLRRLEILAAALQSDWRNELAMRQVSSDAAGLRVQWDTADAGMVDGRTQITTDVESARPQPHLGRTLDDLVAFYRGIGSGRMLMLGAAGAGKSVMVTQFAMTLCAARAPDQPVPVVISASSWSTAPAWDDDATAADLSARFWAWVESELIRVNAGLQKRSAPSTTLARQLLDERLILPIIDGFDQLTQSQRVSLVQALNIDAGDESGLPRIVLTSRPSEFEDTVRTTGIIEHACGIQLENLSVHDTIAYLMSTTPATWAPLQERLQTDPAAAERFHAAINTPLMAFLAHSVYGSSPEQARPNPLELLAADDAETVQGYLLGGFIPAVYRESPYPTKSVLRWYRFLAANLNSDTIAWWTLRAAVPTALRAIPFGLFGGVLGGSFGAVLVALSSAPLWFAATSAAIGLIMGAAIGAYPSPAEPAEFRFTNKAGWRDSTASLTLGLVAPILSWILIENVDRAWWPLLLGGTVAGFFPALGVGHLRKATPGSATAFEEMRNTVPAAFLGAVVVTAVGVITHARMGSLSNWLVIGVVFGVLTGLAYVPSTPASIEPARSMAEMVRTNCAFTLYFSAMFALAYGIVLWAMIGWHSGLAGGLAIGLLFGFGTNTWGQWLVFCRIWLPFQGKLPRSFKHFVEDACHRGVLYQAGPVYRFRHDLLKDLLLFDRSDADVEGAPRCSYEDMGPRSSR